MYNGTKSIDHPKEEPAMKKTLGALIAQTRKEKGMTQLELAEKMG